MSAESRPRSTRAASSGGPEEADGRRRIEVLPDHVIDQIAAGEVVERPASVVKELCENALDAGASHVTVEVEQGGKRLVRVLDNGCGMTEGEVRLALQRHATSKLGALEDLFALSTMGFRGEALPSIAAVSRMSIITRVRDQVAGTRLDIEGGEIVSVQEVGAPVGTQIEVCDLLYNVPARLKFLKGNATEASHVTQAVTRLAMAHEHVHMRLRHGSRTALDAPMHKSRMDRVRAILGSRLGRRLHRVAGEESGIEVDAYLTAPELAQTTTRGVQLYVGRRPVKDRGLLHAINMGYGELVPKGRYPVAVLFVDAPGDDVDVNVHPQKLEVRFSDQEAVYAAVRHVIRRGVAEAPWLADGPEEGVSPVRMRALAASRPPRPGSAGAGASRMAAGHAAATTRMLFDDVKRPGAARPAPAPAPNPASTEPPKAEPGSGQGEFREIAFPMGDAAARPAGYGRSAKGGGGASRAAERSPWPYSSARSEPEPEQPSEAESIPGASPAPEQPPEAESIPGASPAPEQPPEAESIPGASPAPEQPPDAGSIPGRALSPEPGRAPSPEPHPPEAIDPQRFFSELRYIGQLDRTYLLCEAAGELVLVDQHAAHERVAFQRLRERYAQRALPVQRMLFPLTVELSLQQSAVVSECKADLESVGFDIEPFGGATYAVKSVPAGLRQSDASQVLCELLDELAERGGSRALEEHLDLALATIACHSVVRAGDTLSPREVHALFESMDGVDFRAHCPHGRPVLLRISVAEIARRFGRS